MQGNLVKQSGKEFKNIKFSMKILFKNTHIKLFGIVYEKIKSYMKTLLKKTLIR
jgi:hypothetical protein